MTWSMLIVLYVILPTSCLICFQRIICFPRKYFISLDVGYAGLYIQIHGYEKT